MLPEAKDNIWEEHYPLLQPNGTNSTIPINHFFSPEVVNAYTYGVQAFAVTLVTLSVLSLTGLVLCQLFSLSSIFCAFFRLLWLVSPAAAALSLRHIAGTHLNFRYNVMAFPMWEIPPLADLFRCYPKSSIARVLSMSFFIPLLCQVAAYTLVAATRMVNPFNRVFVERAESVFSFDNQDAKDGGLVFYVFYLVIAGVLWDPVPPRRYDFGVAVDVKPIGCSWLLLCLFQEIGWSGALYPALDIIFGHSAFMASVVTGLVWAVWHWPFIIAEKYKIIPAGSGYSVVEAADFEVLSVLTIFTILLVGSRLIMCWIQGKSSYVIWSSTVYHASHCLFIVSVFGQLTGPLYEKAGDYPYFSGEGSICLVVTTWFSTCILSQLFRGNYLKLLSRWRKRRY
ncbi:unnamed protein product [Aphanomyces euteiches]|uniref:CAAX prenyl protease 2/Lysostaphin resistance protein A-like domain-containing protein n=1 Tax=Aphanomyces euteiches TaxID=100861 RepID=A0A6G0XKJ5_9STRA|nr:hypothetical protein Ae201684_003761 [Aphanomyces euteiches]KAH9084936.1 hypothetical protein Ae201684P_002168 [Aphanomyces euteiches]KAH9140780.1 hypothetical protein AeRB84_015016 [Aphanomyces euteiches]